MRLHYVLNHGGTPESKLADVEVHFEEGLLAGLKLVGCSVWRSKKGEAPTVLVPSRSYATAGGIRYFELLRASAQFLFRSSAGFLGLLSEILFGPALLVKKLLPGLFLRQRDGVIALLRGLFCRRGRFRRSRGGGRRLGRSGGHFV